MLSINVNDHIIVYVLCFKKIEIISLPQASTYAIMFAQEPEENEVIANLGIVWGPLASCTFYSALLILSNYIINGTWGQGHIDIGTSTFFSHRSLELGN